MKANLFNGGLSTRRDKTLIAINEAVEYNNIDNSSGSLIPIKDKIDTGINIEKFAYFYEFGQEWISSSNERHYVEYLENLYYSEPATFPKRYDGTTEFQLGITAPSNTPNVQIEDRSLAQITDCTLTETVGTTFPALSLVSYALVNKNGNGLLSRPFYKTINVGSSSTEITISAVTGFEIETEVYRNYNGEYRLVGSITTGGGTVVDNTLDISTNTLLDEEKYLIPLGTYQYLYTYYNSVTGHESAPSGITEGVDLTDEGGTITISNILASSDPQVDQKRIYRVGGNITLFTLVDTITNAATSYLDELGDTRVEGTLLETADSEPPPSGLRFLTEANSIFFGAVGSILHFTPVGKPAVWPTLNFIKYESEIKGIGETSGGILIFLQNKTYIITGSDPSVFTSRIISRQQGCVNHDSIADGTNFLLWASNDGACVSSGGLIDLVSKDKLGKTKLDVANGVVLDEVYYVLQTNGKTLAFDYGFGSIYKEFDFDVDRLFIANDTLYGHKEGSLYQLQASNDNLSMTYKSPAFTEGQYSMVKIYKSIYFILEGDLEVVVHIDGNEAARKSYNEDERVPKELKLNSSFLRGYFMQVSITGTGSVYEMENRVDARQNGK